jgi:hypothetical protein
MLGLFPPLAFLPAFSTELREARAMDKVKREAHRREIELVIVPTADTIETLQENPSKTNAILHVTC